MTKTVNINGHKFELELEVDRYDGEYDVPKTLAKMEEMTKGFALNEREQQALVVLLAKLLVTDSLSTVAVTRKINWSNWIGNLVRHKESGVYNIIASYNQTEEHLEMVDASISHVSQWALIPVEINWKSCLVQQKYSHELKIVEEHVGNSIYFTDSTKGCTEDYRVMRAIG